MSLAVILPELDLKGGATWAPARGEGFQHHEWGCWEVWEECRIGELPGGRAVGAIPTGGWVAWDSSTGQQIGFRSQREAEMFAVLQNEGMATRIVPMSGAAVASAVEFDKIQALVDAELARG